MMPRRSTADLPARVWRQAKRQLRSADWWAYKVPPLLAVAYLLLAIHRVPLARGGPVLVLLTLSIIGTAGFGHFLNDVCDRRADARAAHPNVAAGLSAGGIAVRLIALLTASLVPWLWLPAAGGWSVGALGLLLVLFVLYSVPPVRLKERRFWGVLADALYGHALPAAITGFAFADFAPRPDAWEVGFLALLFGWKLLQGLCGAIYSQIRDRHNDRRSGTVTFALAFGPRRALGLVNRVLLPLQLLAFLLLGGFISVYVPVFTPLYGLFLAATAWKVHRRWRKPVTVYSRTYMGYAYLNDFHERWMPWILLLYLVLRLPPYGILILLHLGLFGSRLAAWAAERWRALRAGPEVGR